MRKYLFLLLLLCLHIAARGQTIMDIDLSGIPKPTQAKSIRYWFDDDVNSITIVSANGGIQSVNTSKLIDGLHIIHYQVIDANNIAGYTASSIFLKIGSSSGSPDTISAKKLLYWYDDEIDIKTIDISGNVQMIDASTLRDGLHTIHFQVLCSNGQITPSSSSIFLQMNIDMENTTAKSLRYWFDDDNTSVKVTDISNGTQILNVTNLIMGLHTLNYQIIDNKGKVSPPVVRMFLKGFDNITEDGENRIIQYQYWLNKKSTDMKTVTLNNATNPYHLIDLLPIQKEPIQSSSFQFEIANGIPTIYAKNNFHIRFHDARGYFSDSFCSFIDYQVQQEVTDVVLLKSGIRSTITKPGENTIKWYKLVAEPGDSVQFRLDRAATVQLFSPSGKEVYNADGAESVAWGGCHAKENGTYYLALHDVKAQQGNTISIDYNHIDKYAVLRQDVCVVGNGGCSTITFDGNGFRDLYAVDFYNAKGDTIHHINIGHESDALTSVLFDFSDARIGMYNAIFHFSEENKIIKNIITVEEARKIELTSTVTYPSTFLRGTSTTYTVKITNKGNMTAYNVPVYTYIQNYTKDGIIHVDYDGLDLQGIYSNVNLSELSFSEIQELREMEKEIGDLPYFVPMKQSIDENINDSLFIRTGLFFVDVAPNSTKELNLQIQSTGTINAWFTIPEKWEIMGETINAEDRRIISPKAPSTVENYYCCYKELIECQLEISSFVYDVASFVLMIIAETNPELGGTPALLSLAAALRGCGISIAGNTLKGFGDALCNSDKEEIKERILEGLRAAAKSAINIPSIISCVSAAISGAGLKLADGTLKTIFKGLGALLTGNSIGNDLHGLGSCGELFKPRPGCPPTPPKGGSSTPVNSFDPNDIYGYTAESTSKAVRDSLTDVYYTIQFENDSTFATASAHDIYLTDTLDAAKFDLSSYTPTKVRISDKSVLLNGDKTFVETMDMRPEINAIAQLEGTFDEKKGIARWHISSLDPMTMEPTTYIMDGVLPVNTNGQGIGEVMFDIKLKPELKHGTEIPNRVGIVFDANDVIMTPTWTNVIDHITPDSRVIGVELLNDSTASVSIEANDDGSGPWRYDVYVQYGEGSGWWKAAENVPIDTTASVKVYDGINHGFYVLVTDSAGNVEKKEPTREFVLNRTDPNVIEIAEINKGDKGDTYYDLQGRRVEKSAIPKKGIYIVTGRRSKAQKIMKH